MKSYLSLIPISAKVHCRQNRMTLLCIVFAVFMVTAVFSMRAVGMDERQMTKMIACEAFTYAVLGCVVGCAIGLPLSKSLYDFLIAGHFPSAVWQFPIISLGVILLFVSIAAIAAVYAPAKRIRNMSITATINEL